MMKRIFIILSIISTIAAIGYLGAFAQPNPTGTEKKKTDDTDVTDPENIRRLEMALTRMRGLEFKKALKVGVKMKAEIKEKMEEDAQKELPEDYDKIRKSLVKLGLIPEDLNLREFMIDLYTEQIGGFYDPKEKELFLVTNAENPNIDMLESLGISWNTLATLHEMTHALQDQNFNLLTLPMDEMTNDDVSTAVKSLVEGEATFVMYDYMLRQRGLDLILLPDMSDQMENMGPLSGRSLIDNAPIYIKEGLIFPYTKGLEFVKFVKARGGWESINTAYADLPASTEQILHPEKYLMDRDYPMAITIPDISAILTSTKWTLLLDNVMGEFSISLLKKQFFPTFTSKRMSEGWDGDKFQVWDDIVNKHSALIWFTTWDEENEAREFFNGYKKIITEKYKGVTNELPLVKLLSREQNKSVWELGRTISATYKTSTGETTELKTIQKNTLVSIEQRGSDVLVLEDIPIDIHDGLAKTLWEKITRAEVKEVLRVEPPKEEPKDKDNAPKDEKPKDSQPADQKSPVEKEKK